MHIFPLPLLSTLFHQINRKTASAEVELAAAKKRVGHLDRQVDVLKMKRANNILTATRAEETASAAKSRAEEAEQVGFWQKWNNCLGFQTSLLCLVVGSRAITQPVGVLTGYF